MLHAVIATLVFVASGALAEPCEYGWRFFPGTRSCYKLLNEKAPWSISEIKCLFEGAHHISIGSFPENSFISEVAQHQEVWTGAAFFGSTSGYTWSDNKPFGVFENWETGSRPSLNPGRRCVKINPSGEWFQSCCKKQAVTVCKKAAAYDNSIGFLH